MKIGRMWESEKRKSEGKRRETIIRSSELTTVLSKPAEKAR